MADLPNSPIPVVPAESPGDPDYPTLVQITVADLVGPLAANRQPTQLETRTETLRDRTNLIIEDLNFIETGGPGGLNAFLPRDGGQAMAGDLDFGTNKGINVVDPTAAQDAATKAYVDSNIVQGGLGYIGEIKIVRGAPPTTSIDVEFCRVVDTTNTKILAPSNNSIIDTALAAGLPGRLDTGVRTALTWYYIWAIGDSITSNPDDVLLSLSPGAPFGAGAAGTPLGISPVMPAGYNVFRRIGSIVTDGAADFYSMRKINGVTMYEEIHSVFLTGLGGGFGRGPVSCAAFIPPTAERGIFRANVVCSGANFGATLNIFPGAQSPVAGAALALTGGGGGAGASPNDSSGAHGFVDVSATQTVDMSGGNAGPSFAAYGAAVVGYIEDMKHST